MSNIKVPDWMKNALSPHDLYRLKARGLVGSRPAERQSVGRNYVKKTTGYHASRRQDNKGS
jgi:hypothetical protein